MFPRTLFFVFRCGTDILRRCGMAGGTKQPHARTAKSHNQHEPRSSTHNTKRVEDLLAVF